MFSAAVRSSLV